MVPLRLKDYKVILLMVYGHGGLHTMGCTSSCDRHRLQMTLGGENLVNFLYSLLTRRDNLTVIGIQKYRHQKPNSQPIQLEVVFFIPKFLKK